MDEPVIDLENEEEIAQIEEDLENEEIDSGEAGFLQGYVRDYTEED